MYIEEDVRPNCTTSVVNPVEVNKDITDNDHGRDGGTQTFDDKTNAISQPLPSTPCTHSEGDVAVGEKLASDVANNETVTSGKKWNNTHQARHWCVTLNNYTLDDEVRWKQALTDGKASGEVEHAIVAKEVGDSGTRHFQAYTSTSSK